MSFALGKTSKLKPEVRLAQAVSQFEADLSPQQKRELHTYRQQISNNPPNPSDVMRLTAQIDRLASTKGCRRCFGPRFTNFLQAVQQFAALGDVIVGGSQNIIACGVWALLLVNFSSYLEKLSTLLMVAGRSAPRHQSIAVLYPRSTHLQWYLSEYYIVVVGLCHKLLKFTQRSTVGQLAVALGSLDITIYQAELEQWASSIKEEVSILMAERIEGEAQETEHFRALTTNVFASTLQLQRLKMNQQVLSSLSRHDFEKDWKRTRKIGTTTLLNRNIAYQDWKGKGESCTLLYTGKLGCGKSVLLANMVDDINLHIQNKGSLVAYFFAPQDTPESLKARTVIGSLACQFLRSIPDLDLTGTAKCLDMERSTLDVERIFDLLQHALPAHFEAYVILDGIGDCDDTQREQLIQYLNKLQVTFKVSLCVSHRVESNGLLKYYLENFTAATSTSIPENNPDIEEFIEAELESCIRSQKLVLGEPSLILEIQDALQAGSKGMFLWTALQIESLCFLKTDDTIRQALRDLPKDLSETFSRILNRSRGLGEPYQRRVLEVVIAAQRPLTAEELGGAISVVPRDIIWNPAKALNDVSSVLSCCGSLLIKDEEDLTIRLVHHSVKTFLVSGYKEGGTAFTIQGARRMMAEIVITYLNYSIFDTQLSTAHSPQVLSQPPMPKIVHSALGSSSTASNLALRFLKSRKQVDFDVNKVLRETREAFGTRLIHQIYFRSYTGFYWVQHIMEVSDMDPDMYRLLLRLFRGNAVDANTTNDFARTPLSLAAGTGTEIVVRALLESAKADLGSKDRYGQTPLSWAARNGHKAVVELLIKSRPTLLHSRDISGQTPLSWAARNGHKTVVELLIEIRYASIETEDIYGQTALFWAVRNGHKTVVDLLIKIGKADVESRDKIERTPLSLAAGIGNEEIIKALLELGKADVGSKEMHGQTPLTLAAINGHKAAVRILIEIGKANVKSKDFNGQTPLSWAARTGHKAVVKLLVEMGKADVEWKDKYGQTPLSWAARMGHETVVRLLLETGKADIESKCKYNETPLSWAAMKGHESVVQLLLETGKVDVKWQDLHGKSPLSYAAENGHKTVLKLLIVTDKVDAGWKDSNGRSLLSYAVDCGYETVKLLLETGKVDAHLRDSNWRSLLSYAAENGHETVVKLLLEMRKLNITRPDINGRSPLLYAVEKGHETVVKLLLAKGQLDVKSPHYRSAFSNAKKFGRRGIITLLQPYIQK